MAHVKKHDYHILQPSIWPLVAAVGAFAMLFGAVNWMHSGSPWLFLIGLAAVLYVMFAWWSDVVHESHDGDHTPVVRLGLKYGFIMFIMSEVMFFVAWFWAFFKHTIFPMSEYEASTYVIPDIHIVDPFHLPLINTLVLLLSGCLVTWAHHALVHNGARKDIEYGLLGAVVLGLAQQGQHQGVAVDDAGGRRVQRRRAVQRRLQGAERCAPQRLPQVPQQQQWRRGVSAGGTEASESRALQGSRCT
mgnify:CR=1 FL=1